MVEDLLEARLHLVADAGLLGLQVDELDRGRRCGHGCSSSCQAAAQAVSIRSASSRARAASSPVTRGRGISPRTAARKSATLAPSGSLPCGVWAQFASSAKGVVLVKSW